MRTREEINARTRKLDRAMKSARFIYSMQLRMLYPSAKERAEETLTRIRELERERNELIEERRHLPKPTQGCFIDNIYITQEIN